MEAIAGESKKDFMHKIAICKKEAKETVYWLNLLSNLETGVQESIKLLKTEAHELLLIFSAIFRKR